MKTIVAFIVGLLIATAAWSQIDKESGTVWVPGSGGTLNGRHNYQMGLRPRWRRGVALEPVPLKTSNHLRRIAAIHTVL
jgi:hypothetical protein